jgi:predicted Zn-dependent peptidase
MKTTSTRLWPTLSLVLVLVAGCSSRNGPSTETPPGGGARLAGLASFTAEMLRRGAGERTAEQIAEEVAFVGGDLSVDTRFDYTVVQVQVLREHLDFALGLLADLAQRPTFAPEEIDFVRQRELDRLAHMSSQPQWIANQAFFRALYGPGHPYNARDALPETVRSLNREHLVAFHAEHYVPRNSLLVVAGDVQPDEIRAAAERHFGGWAERPAPVHAIPEPPARTERSVLVVHRPDSTQAELWVGNTGVNRADPEFLELFIASQVLGGSSSARLFENLRERCGYTYGIYSNVYTGLGRVPFVISGSVETRYTAGALREIFAELDRIRASEPPADDLAEAQAYLVGSFPFSTETAADLADLVHTQRVYGLPDDYWSTYRSALSAVSASDALTAARDYIRPDDTLVVIVGDADQVAEPARRYGHVTVVDVEGNHLRDLEAAPGEWPGGEPPPCPDAGPADAVSRTEQPPAPTAARDLDFPEVHEAALANGLEVLTVEQHTLPLVHLRLIVRSGRASDPMLAPTEMAN